MRGERKTVSGAQDPREEPTTVGTGEKENRGLGPTRLLPQSSVHQ